jgi:hypothetical protein
MGTQLAGQSVEHAVHVTVPLIATQGLGELNSFIDDDSKGHFGMGR